MQVQDILMLASYNRRTNEAMNGHISQLTSKQFTQEHPAYFPSIQSLCNHLYTSDHVWLKRFSALRDFPYVAELDAIGEVTFGKKYIDDIPGYLEKRGVLDSLIETFASQVTEDDLTKELFYHDSGGNPHTKPFGALVLHMFNHQTHHKGMISVFLEAAGIDNDFNSLMNYV